MQAAAHWVTLSITAQNPAAQTHSEPSTLPPVSCRNPLLFALPTVNMHDIAASQSDREELVTRLEDCAALAEAISATSPNLQRRVSAFRAALELALEQAESLAACR